MFQSYVCEKNTFITIPGDWREPGEGNQRCEEDVWQVIISQTISVACDYEESDDDNDDVDSPNGDYS